MDIHFGFQKKKVYEYVYLLENFRNIYMMYGFFIVGFTRATDINSRIKHSIKTHSHLREPVIKNEPAEKKIEINEKRELLACF